MQEVGDDPLAYLRSFTGRSAEHTAATRGHPPAPVLVLWALQRLGVTDHLALGLLVTAVGALLVPLVLAAVRDMGGEAAARPYAPVLALAPYAVWIAVSMDAVVATIGAAMAPWPGAGHPPPRLARRCLGGAGRAAAGHGGAVLVRGAVARAVRGVPQLRPPAGRPEHVRPGSGALLPVLGAARLGFAWTDGLGTAYADFAERDRAAPLRAVVGPDQRVRAAAGGRPAHLREPAQGAQHARLAVPGGRVRGGAVLGRGGAGAGRGGARVAAVLPVAHHRRGGAGTPRRRPGPRTAALVAVGAVSAMVIEAVLSTPW